MDSLTARYLARELDARWRGRRATGCVFDREARAVLLGVDGSWVCFDLADPDVIVRTVPAPPHAGTSGLMHGWTVVGVHAPEDDRRIVVELERPGRFKGSPGRRATLAISALPTARGARLADAGGARLATLGAKLPGAALPRSPLDEAAVAAAAARNDSRALLARRWMSPAIVRWLLAAPERAAERYRQLVSDAPARPARCAGRLVPFPWCDEAEPAASLIEPIAAAEANPGCPLVADMQLMDTPAARARRRLERELDRAAQAPRLREAADLLLALGDAPAPERVVLGDGSAVTLDRTSGTSAVAVAERLYHRARSMDRAAATIPERLARLERAADASAPADAAAAEGVGRRSPAAGRDARRAREAAGDVPARPPIHPRRGRGAPRTAPAFRTYRSSGGLEIWVGRGAASNDELTFHASSPEDVWLHARDASGAHVVLRWQHDASPPARDLQEAALLAAWHSKARGSAVVPVDWTRRKHVRKPHGAAPGLVVVQRAKTVFVRPSAGAERRLRADG